MTFGSLLTVRSFDPLVIFSPCCGCPALSSRRPDGIPRALTRAEFSTAIGRMRLRQKQIIRLAVEERRSQEEVCALLNGISLRTLQRDQAEVLDLLAQL